MSSHNTCPQCHPSSGAKELKALPEGSRKPKAFSRQYLVATLLRPDLVHKVASWREMGPGFWTRAQWAAPGIRDSDQRPIIPSHPCLGTHFCEDTLPPPINSVTSGGLSEPSCRGGTGPICSPHFSCAPSVPTPRHSIDNGINGGVYHPSSPAVTPPKAQETLLVLMNHTVILSRLPA